MLSIHLHNLKFFAHHGLHPEETILGNQFEVNVDVQWEESSETITSIGETIDYVKLFEIVSKRMQEPAHLLETVAMEIGRNIFIDFPFVHNISVQVKKLNAGVASLEGSLGVSWTKSFR